MINLFSSNCIDEESMVVHGAHLYSLKTNPTACKTQRPAVMYSSKFKPKAEFKLSFQIGFNNRG